jgi:hypothetical protein
MYSFGRESRVNVLGDCKNSIPHESVFQSALEPAEFPTGLNANPFFDAGDNGSIAGARNLAQNQLNSTIKKDRPANAVKSFPFNHDAMPFHPRSKNLNVF